jgi:hypothetical protein
MSQELLQANKMQGQREKPTPPQRRRSDTPRHPGPLNWD